MSSPVLTTTLWCCAQLLGLDLGCLLSEAEASTRNIWAAGVTDALLPVWVCGYWLNELLHLHYLFKFTPAPHTGLGFLPLKWWMLMLAAAQLFQTSSTHNANLSSYCLILPPTKTHTLSPYHVGPMVESGPPSLGTCDRPFQNTKVRLNYLVKYPFLPHTRSYHRPTYVKGTCKEDQLRNLEKWHKNKVRVISYANTAEHVF